jgi:putative endonuclease
MHRPKPKIKIIYYFYILKCQDKTLYCGVTKDMVNRVRLHNSGFGSAYVSTHGGGRIVYFEKYKTIGNALQREIEVKKYPRSKKLKLIKLWSGQKLSEYQG